MLEGVRNFVIDVRRIVFFADRDIQEADFGRDLNARRGDMMPGILKSEYNEFLFVSADVSNR
jgi:hypothetical protein